MGHFSLNSFLKQLASGKIVLYTPVYSTFTRIPDKILNANQKQIIQGFMLFSQATKILKQLGLIDNKFQLPIGIIAQLVGFSRFQAQRAIKKIPAAVKLINQHKLLKNGEKLVFEIKDENGVDIPEHEINTSGGSYWYVFRYTTPRAKEEIKGSLHEDAELDKNDPSPELKYDQGTDPHLADKKKEFDKIAKDIPSGDFRNLYYYPLDEIVRAVDYYLLTLQEKKDQAVAARRDVEKVGLNYMWLKLCLEKKYYLTKFTPRQKVKNEIEQMKILIAKVRSFITDTKLKTDLKLLHDRKPSHRYNQFENVAALHSGLYSEYQHLNPDTQKAIYELAKKYFRFENAKDLKDRDNVVHDKENAKHRLQQIISVAYLNFI